MAFNQDIIPGSNNTRDIGSPSNKIKDVHTATIKNGFAKVDLTTGIIVDSSNATSVDFENHKLLDGSASESVDYTTRTLTNSSANVTVDWDTQQLKQGAFIAATWDSIGLDMYDSVNTNNARIAGLGNIQLATGTDMNVLMSSNRTTGLAAAGTTTLTITSSRFYIINYRVSRASGGNDCKVGTLHIAKENIGNNTNASISDTGVATNVSMDDVVFSINASGNLLITNNTAFSIDLRYELHQL